MRGGGHPGRVSSGDAAAQKAQNAEAPRIPDLLKRIGDLFAPYRSQITVTIVLVLVSAALSVAPPLLTKQAFDLGLFPPGGPNMPVLLELVGIMVLIWIASSALGVWQTWLTATVGNKVMGSLRVRLFEHLQAMELAFFTRTKTGIIQSRLQNDVGGVAGVLSNTISSVIGNTVTVIAAFVSMLILSWQLTIVAVILLPVLVLAQRKVGQVRARIATKTQESLSDMTAITQETLSVSGILLAKSFNQQKSETDRYALEVCRSSATRMSPSRGNRSRACTVVNATMVPAVMSGEPPTSSHPATRYTMAGIADRKMLTIAKNHWPLICWLTCSRTWVAFSSA